MLLQKSRSKKDAMRPRQVVCNKALLKVYRFHKPTISTGGKRILMLVKLPIIIRKVWRHFSKTACGYQAPDIIGCWWWCNR